MGRLQALASTQRNQRPENLKKRTDETGLIK